MAFCFVQSKYISKGSFWCVSCQGQTTFSILDNQIRDGGQEFAKAHFLGKFADILESSQIFWNFFAPKC